MKKIIPNKSLSFNKKSKLQETYCFEIINKEKNWFNQRQNHDKRRKTYFNETWGVPLE